MSSGRQSTASNERTIAQSFQEYGRGVAGGLMFSLPLLYTMEVWWGGFTTHPWRLGVYVSATFLLLLGYNRHVGLRRDASMTEVAIDSIEELGLGLIISALALFLLGRITFDMTANEIVGQIVIEAMTVAIGVSVVTAQLGGGGGEDEGFGGNSPPPAKRENEERAGRQTEPGKAQPDAGKEGRHFRSQLVVAVCGAMLFASNVAPTEEIIVIAIEISWVKLLGLAFVSLLLGSFILHYSEFTGTRELVRTDNFSAILSGTVITYAVALVVSAFILWFFGRFDGVSAFTALAQVVVLAVAATLGASAGRLLLQ